MFSFVKIVKQPICKAFIEFTFRHIPLIFSVYLLTADRFAIAHNPLILNNRTPTSQTAIAYFS